MELRRGITLILLMVVMTTATVLPCFSEEKNTETDKDIWAEDERGPGRGGPGGGPGRGGRGRGRFELTEEYIDRFLNELKKSDPSKAKNLVKLRESNPEKFSEEIRKSIREQFEKRIESWRKKWREEFLEWLGNAVPKQARELNNLKDTDPDLYSKKYDLVRRKYQRIYDEQRRNPELAKVLMAEIELDERQEELLNKIKETRKENEKKQLMAQLEEVVSNKYDLIVQKRQIAYDFLLRRLEELQRELNKSSEELRKFRDPEIKLQNVKERIKELTNQSRRFPWR